MSKDFESPPANYIKSFEVQGLFGDTDYKLKVPESSDPRVLVLYGQNGGGKTTILKIIRSLLSPEHNAGLRTSLAGVPFSRALVRLVDGTVVEAFRAESIRDSYVWKIQKPGRNPIELFLIPKDGRIRSDDWNEKQTSRYGEIIGELKSIFPQVTYLDDKRTFFDRSKLPRARTITRQLEDGAPVQMEMPHEGNDDEHDPVRISLKDLLNATRRETLVLSNRGSQGAQSIYGSLVDRISSASSQNERSFVSREFLIRKLEEEQARSEGLATYGLLAAVNHERMIEGVRRAPEERLDLMANILNPYIESSSARFDAIQSLHDSIDSWVNTLAKFLFPKTINFRVGDEVAIFSKSKQRLSPSVLSSGERHLLLMLTKAFLMRSAGGLMLIDEPELSLNVVWQRQLIHAMVNAFGGGACQLVVASHSLEIAARFESSLITLN